jgi:DNA repair protein RadA/Sms
MVYYLYMAKNKTIYICNNCGYQSTQWIGQCPECSAWNSFVEDVIVHKVGTQRSSNSISIVNMSDIEITKLDRLPTGLSEFDRVLGGGFVKGQVVLLGGSPGVGKSTLLTEVAKSLNKRDILYVCGEESTHQIKIRTNRMGYNGANLKMLPTTDVQSIISNIESIQNEIALVIIDSIQTLYSEDFSGIAGSISQVKGCSQLITDAAKRFNVPIILVGHVTKEGTVAGPKLLEHIVDTVLYLEGDSQYLFRLLRTTKNRFGPVSEVGVFEMIENGMREISNPSELFLQDTQNNVSGSVITVTMEGFRPMLFEIQALAVSTSFGYPRRTTTGYNANRLQVLLAIIEKRSGTNVSGHDVYLSVAGGFKISEYSIDLAACIAVISSLKNKPVKSNTAIFGECGLGGEVRRVPHIDKRIQEAKRLGYTNVISPSNVKNLKQAIELAF